LDLDHVVEYVATTALADLDVLAPIRLHFLAQGKPQISTIPVTRLRDSRALIEVEATMHGHTLDGIVHLPSLMAPSADGIEGQAEAIFDDAQRLLVERGLSLKSVAKVVSYCRIDQVDRFPEIQAVRRRRTGPVPPCATGILVDRLPIDRALIQLEITASHRALEQVPVPWESGVSATFSQALRAGDWLLTSGQAAIDPQTRLTYRPDDVVAQAEFAYQRLGGLLRAAGLGFAAVVRTTEYLARVGLERGSELDALRRRHFEPNFPIGVRIAIGALLRHDLKFEVDATALLAPS
jgi:enamine deaminase RidA (YjgF/YER057c/UK114 family)